MAAVNRRLRQWGRYVPRETERRPATPQPEPPSFMATYDDPLLMDTTLDPKPRRGGRHRRQR